MVNKQFYLIWFIIKGFGHGHNFKHMIQHMHIYDYTNYNIKIMDNYFLQLILRFDIINNIYIYLANYLL